jgi:hypothetical protein
LLDFGEPFPDFNRDMRNPALRLDMESLKVHHVEAVKFKDHTFTVHRHRSEKSTEHPTFGASAEDLDDLL